MNSCLVYPSLLEYLKTKIFKMKIAIKNHILQICNFAILQFCNFAILQFCNFAILQFCNFAIYTHTKISRRVKIDTLKTPINNLRGPKSEMSFFEGGVVRGPKSHLETFLDPFWTLFWSLEIRLI